MLILLAWGCQSEPPPAVPASHGIDWAAEIAKVKPTSPYLGLASALGVQPGDHVLLIGLPDLSIRSEFEAAVGPTGTVSQGAPGVLRGSKQRRFSFVVGPDLSGTDREHLRSLVAPDARVVFTDSPTLPLGSGWAVSDPLPLPFERLTQVLAVPMLVDPPPGFVDLAAIPGIQIDARYATNDNFTGAPLPGYDVPGAWLAQPAAKALADVARGLQADGLHLHVYDAYRPVRATRAMVTWTETTQQQHLVSDGYIAARSGHNKGHTVDLTLADDRGPLDMGGVWDHFGPSSALNAVDGKAYANRKRLADGMMAAGYRPYSKEWWHFRYPVDGLEPLDVPYGARPE